MIYEEYYKKFRNYGQIKKEINDLENKKISLMRMADIQAIAPKDGNGINNDKDKFGIYLAELEEVENILIKDKKVLEELKKQLKEKEKELRESKEILDKVYLYKYLYKMKYLQIAPKIGYEKTKTYDLINEVAKNLEKIAFAEKNGKM